MVAAMIDQRIPRVWLALGLMVACSGRSDAPAAGGSGSAQHATAAPATPAGRLEPGLAFGGSSTWSPEGFYVSFPVLRRDGEHRDPSYLVVVPRTGESFVVEHASRMLFARDRQNLAAVIDGKVVVYDVTTGKPVGTPSPLAGDIQLTPEGRLAWAEPTKDGYRVHLRNMSYGKDEIKFGLPLPAPTDRAHGAPEVTLGFDGNLHAVAATPNALRVWFRDHVNPDVTIDGPITAPEVTLEGIAYARVIDDAHQIFTFIPLPDLSVQSPVPITLQRDPVCGAGEMTGSGEIERCSPHSYLVRGSRAFCVWDTATGKLQSQIAPTRPEVHCANDVAWLGDLPPCGPYTFFSSVTGKPIAKPAELVTDPPSGPPGAHVLDLPSGRTTAYDSPRKDRIAGVDRDRATVWSADQKIVWQAPAPSEAAAIGFSRSELVVSDVRGLITRIDLASRKLRTAQLADCALRGGDPIVVAPDGKVAAPCVRNGERALVLEGAAAPVYPGKGAGWKLASATGAASSAIAWFAVDGVHAWTFPAATQRWTYDRPQGLALAISADGARFAVADAVGAGASGSGAGSSTAGSAAAGSAAAGSAFAVSIHDADNHELAVIPLPSAPTALALSPDGARVAVKLGGAAPTGTAPADGAFTIYDATSGAVVDQLPPDAVALAWDPSGKRVAYARAAGLVIRDIVAHRDLETRPLPLAPDGPAHAIAWSPDGTRLALLADQRVTLWEPGKPASTFLLSGAGAAELRPDATAVLLGDAAIARGLLTCKIGPRNYPITRCASQLVSSP